MKRKVAHLISGGLDSSYAAYILKKSAYEVYCFSYIPVLEESCSNEDKKSEDSIKIARKVCKFLDLPHEIIDIKKEFKKRVINKFFEDYLKGITPNPCYLCNRVFKLGYLVDYFKKKGFEYVSTGHYAKNDGKFIYKAKDSKKDQSYFLAGIKKENLKYILFPLGNFTKDEIRKESIKLNLPSSFSEESQDICFLKEDYRTYFKTKKGKIVEYSTGKILGEHNGFVNYTIGQRKGLGLGYKHPLYVVNIDFEKNIVFVDKKEFCYKNSIYLKAVEIYDKVLKDKVYDVKIRYNSPSTPAVIYLQKNILKVDFKNKVFAPTPGQIGVIYENDKVIASGIILK